MRIFFCRKHDESPRGGSHRPRLRRDDGFTLFEVLIAAVVLIVGLTTLFGLLDTSLKASASTRAREGATNLAREVLEDARTIAYAQLSPSSIVGDLQAMNGLADASSAAGWQVVQRGITYTVTASECSIDDPKDKYGKHTNSSGENPFCADSKTEGTVTEDPQPEDLKRITVDVTWAALGRTPGVHQVGTVTAAAGAIGLSASELKLKEPTVTPLWPQTAPVIENPAMEKLTFSVTAPAGTTAMAWSLEGTTQTPAPTFEKGTTWTFSWTISQPSPKIYVSDGTYVVGAQAINATGVTGPPVSIPVTLIRGKPAAPKAIKGGFNTVKSSGLATAVAELQWQANVERNVIGYRVYSPSNTGNPSHLVCPSSESTLSLAVSCIDFAPPAQNAANLTYSVMALYRDAKGVVQQEDTPGPGTFKLTPPPPAGPNAPTALSLEKHADGSVTVKWSAPASGTAVSFYRIYRGSTDYTSRYDVTALTTYTDTDSVTPHEYWVTAVSEKLTESPFSESKFG